MSRPKHSAGKLITPEKSRRQKLGLALFGGAVETEQKQAIFELASLFEEIGSATPRERKVSQPFAEREFDRVARPLLIEALLHQDAKAFLQVVEAIEAVRANKLTGKPLYEKHAAVIRLAKPNKTIQELTEEISRILPQGIDPAETLRLCKQIGSPYKKGQRGRKKKSDN